MPLERFGLKRKMIHRITIQDTIPDNIPFRLLRGNFITRDTLHASRKIAAGWNAGDRSGSGITLWGITINIPVCCTGWENTRSDFFQSVCIYIYIYMRLYSSRNVHSLWNGGKPSGGGIKMEHNGIDIEPVNAYIWSYTKIISIGTKGGAWALFAVGGKGGERG